MKILAVIVGSLSPVCALVLYFAFAGEARILAEGGVWSLAVLASTFLFGLAAPALAAFTPAPRPLWAGLATVPLLVGAVGTWLGVQMVTAALGQVSAADRLIMAAQGSGEVASIFALGLMAGGACVVGVAAVIVVVERGPGGVLLLVTGGGLVAFGVRWLATRQGLMAFASVSAADRSVLLASALNDVKLLAIVGGVVVVGLLLLGVGSLLLRRGEWAPASSAIALSAIAVVVVVVAAGGHVSISAMPALTQQPLPLSPLVAFAGPSSGPPGLFIKAGSTEDLAGDPDVVIVAAGARGVDLRRGLAAMARRASDGGGGNGAAVVFVGPAPVDPLLLSGLSIPAVLEPLLANRTSGVSTRLPPACPAGSAWPCLGEGTAATHVVVIGPSRAAADLTVGAARVLVRATDGPLDWQTESIAESVVVAFDDDVDAVVFAAVLQRLAVAVDRGAPSIFVLAEPPPGAADLAKRQPEAPVGDIADKGVIARVVRSHQRAIQACYERELAKNPNLVGKAVVSFAIEGSGRARVDNIEGLEVIAPCLRAEINRWVFPAPKDGDEVSVRFPFVFKTAG